MRETLTRLRDWFRRDALAREVDEELAFHRGMLVRDQRAAGSSEPDAQTAAARRLGNLTRLREGLRDMWRIAWIDELTNDLRYTLRGFRRQPGFTAVVTVTFALGIGANAAMFGIVDHVLLSAPPDIVQPDGVVRIFFDRPAAGMTAVVSPQATFPSLVALRDRVSSFSDVAVYEPGMRVFGTGIEAHRIHALAATGNLWSLLGIRPALGRFFTEREDVPPAGTPVAVLGYGFWQSQFGGVRDVLGRTIIIDSTHYTILGVAPRGFTGVDVTPVDIILPMAPAWVGDDPHWNTARYMLWASGIARLKPGISLQVAAAEATRIVRTDAMALDGPKSMDAQATVRLGPIPLARGPEVGQARDRGQVAEWLSGVSLVLLLVACANVANLLLARAMRRRREIAVRLALGVERARLTALMLMESLLLALAGGGAGFVVASFAGRALRAVLLPDVAPGDAYFDPRVAAVAALAIVLTGILTGLAPAMHVGRRDLTDALKSGGRDGSPSRSRLRQGLMVAQTALSVVLLVGAGLFVRSLRNIRTMDYGFDPNRLLAVSVNFPNGTSRDAQMAAWDRLVARAQTLPGVARAALSETMPFWSTISGRVAVPGRDSIPQTASGRPYFNAVSPEYFATMGTHLRAGRAFTATDRSDAPHVVIVNETMARVIWPGERALGQCMKIGGDSVCSTVVGVVQDEKQRALRGEVAMQYYAPIAQARGPSMRVLVIRTTVDPAVVREGVRRALVSAVPSAGFVEAFPLQDRIEPEVRPWTLGASLFSVFGLLALATATIGLYSVIAYGVTQRSHEFGVRAALGASASGLLRLVLGEGVRMAVAGLAIGAALALVATHWIEALLFGVPRYDPLVFLVVSVTLFVAATAASLIPAWRAARVDPATALREE